MRYELEPKEKITGNAILYEGLDNKDITKNKAYLVIGHDGKKHCVSIIDNELKISNYSWGPGCGRRFIKEVSIEHAEPGDDIIFLKDMDYNSGPPKGNPKKGQVFTITKIEKDGTIKYGLHNIHKTFEYGVQPKDVVILKTIKSDDEKQIIENPIENILKDLTKTLEKNKKQNKEAIMPFQDIINSIFGVSAYDAKPKFLVTIYKPDGSEYANATADSIETIKQKAATDYRLIGHKIVAYKLHTEITTEIPVVATRLKNEKLKEETVDK